MTSQINYASITTNYPVAGIDNDSQGFRDNFTAIAAGLAQAKTEITALQGNSVLKADLATSSNPVQNNLQGSTIFNALYNQFYGVFKNGGTVETSTAINLEDGPVQQFTLSGDATLTFTNWPTSGYAVIRVLILSNGNGVFKPTFATSNAGTIRYDVGYPTLPNSSSYGFKVGGESVKSITVTDPGDGYITTAGVSFTSPVLPSTVPDVPTGTATYKVLSASPVSGQAGTGYTTGDKVVINENPSVILSVSATAGAIVSLSVVSGGDLALPLAGPKTLTSLTGAGVGGAVTVNCGVKAITLTNPGDGYTTVPPTITVDIGNGNRALASATLTTNTNDNPKVIEAWTVDGGQNVYLRFVGEYN